MKNLYNKYKFIVERIKDIRLEANYNKDYLYGNVFYYKFLGKDYIHNKTDESIKFFEKKNRIYELKENKLKAAFFGFINFFWEIKLDNKDKKENKFEGDVLMKTRQKNIKIFNFNDDLVMNLIDDEEEYMDTKEIYNYFKQYYDIPIVDSDTSKQFFVEKYVRFKSYINWSYENKEMAIEKVLENLSSQVENITSKEIKTRSTDTLYSLLKDKDIEQNLFEKIVNTVSDIDYDDEWPIIRCHGDLNFNNILLEKGEEQDKFYFIDWEDSDRCIFFYDFMNCIFVEAMYSDDYSYLEKYMEGKYDKWLNNIFDTLSIKFVSEKKRYYLSLYVMERIVRFEFIQNRNRINILLQKYEKVLGNMLRYN